MKLKNLIAPALLSCAVLCSALQDGLSGKWTGSLRAADSSAYPLTYNFTLIGDSVAGTAKSTLGEFPIDQGWTCTTTGRCMPIPSASTSPSTARWHTVRCSVL
jgi:hypothetical protein